MYIIIIIIIMCVGWRLLVRNGPVLQYLYHLAFDTKSDCTLLYSQYRL